MKIFCSAKGCFARILLLFTGVGITACSTSLESKKIENFSNISRGQVYYLPRVDFQIATTRELRKCGISYLTDTLTIQAWLADQLEAATLQDTDEQTMRLIAAIPSDPILKIDNLKAALGTQWSDNLAAYSRIDDKKSTPKSQMKALRNEMARISAIIAGAKPSAIFNLEASIGAQATSSITADTSHSYTLSYERMQSGLKGTDYAVEVYPNGTLKAVNVAIDDQTGPAIQSVLGGIVKIAAAAGGFPLQSRQAQSGKAKGFLSFSDWGEAETRNLLSPCKPDIALKLYQRSGVEDQADAYAKAALETLKKIDKLSGEQVNMLAARDKAKAALKDMHASDPDYPAAAAALKNAESALKLASSALNDAKAAQASNDQDAAKVTSRLATLRKALSDTLMSTIRPQAEGRSLKIEGEEIALQKWLNGPSQAYCNKAPEVCDSIEKFKRSLTAYADLYLPGLPMQNANDETQTGIYYRQPVKATLLVCKIASCLNTQREISAHPDTILLNTLVDIPQLGALAVLPLKNETFQNNTLGASFAETGTLTKVIYKSNAAAVKAAAVFESSADTVLKFTDAKRLQESTKLDANTAELESRKKLIDAQLSVEKAQADLDNFRESQKKDTK